MQPFTKKLRKHFGKLHWRTEEILFHDHDWRKEDYLKVCVHLEERVRPVSVTVDCDCFGKEIKVSVYADTGFGDVLENRLLMEPIRELISSDPRLSTGTGGGFQSIYIAPMTDPDPQQVEEAVRAVAQMYLTVQKAVASAQKLIRGYAKRESRKRAVATT